jgi:tyrosine-protein phosphatase SIW14
MVQDALDDDEEFCPPENFAMIESGIYRSAFPMKRNFSYLKRLGLRSILTLILEEYPAANREFNEQNGVRLFQFGMEGNKEPFRSMPPLKAAAALQAVLDPRHHPILIHCNEGKHRTGCLVGLVRRARGWALSSILDEYMHYAQAKGRIVDQRFIELFDPSLLDAARSVCPSDAAASDAKPEEGGANVGDAQAPSMPGAAPVAAVAILGPAPE